jgi:hypothetical protein
MTPWTHPPRSTRFLKLPPILHRHADTHTLNASLYCKYTLTFHLLLMQLTSKSPIPPASGKGALLQFT